MTKKNTDNKNPSHREILTPDNIQPTILYTRKTRDPADNSQSSLSKIVAKVSQNLFRKQAQVIRILYRATSVERKSHGIAWLSVVWTVPTRKFKPHLWRVRKISLQPHHYVVKGANAGSETILRFFFPLPASFFLRIHRLVQTTAFILSLLSSVTSFPFPADDIIC